MRKINQFFKKPNFKKTAVLDKETVFYICNKIIISEYGTQGGEKIKPDFYKKGKLFLKINSANWANEIWMNKKEITNKINKEIGSDEVSEIKIKK